MSSPHSFDIICGASLYWETTLWQRPHQIMSRIAADNNVLYVRPIDWRMYRQNKAKWTEEHRFGSPLKNLQLYSPLILPWSQYAAIRTLNNLVMTHKVKKKSSQISANKKVLWLYSPMSSYLIGSLGESLVIYDCMDDHAAFRNANPQLEAMENRILQHADVVFTGGRSLYDSKKDQNKNTYLFPSAVDSDHFTAVTRENTPIPKDMKELAKPIIGYFGAIDERLNYKLIQNLADKNPNWSFIFIGPFLKIGKHELARGKNIHYLGKKEYEDLPSYLAHFDAGLMPFAMNKSTKKISPTKTLEYMAAGCRIVSTPIRDVLADYKGIVRIGDESDGITAQLKTILTECEPERIELGKSMARKKSWNNTVHSMKSIICDKLNLQTE